MWFKVTYTNEFILTTQRSAAQGLADQQRRLIRADGFVLSILLASVPISHHHLSIGPLLLLLLHQKGSLWGQLKVALQTSSTQPLTKKEMCCFLSHSHAVSLFFVNARQPNDCLLNHNPCSIYRCLLWITTATFKCEISTLLLWVMCWPLIYIKLKKIKTTCCIKWSSRWFWQRLWPFQTPQSSKKKKEKIQVIDLFLQLCFS